MRIMEVVVCLLLLPESVSKMQIHQSGSSDTPVGSSKAETMTPVLLLCDAMHVKADVLY